ncbi:hypothetical protein [Micromonospora humida]|uniref:hypothetical protein n=1 Tax=Micromonospora humida TaxID=2809018 RepID=UPI003449E5A3
MGREQGGPQGADPEAEFVEKLKDLKRAVGDPSFKEIADYAAGGRSTYNDLINGKTRPTWPNVKEFVQACYRIGKRDDLDLDQWGRDFQRMRERQALSTAPRVAVSPAVAEEAGALRPSRPAVGVPPDDEPIEMRPGAEHVSLKGFWMGVNVSASVSLLLLLLFFPDLPKRADGADPSGADPIEVAAEVITQPCMSNWVVPVTPRQLGSVSLDVERVDRWEEWPPGKGGVAAAPGIVDLQVRGTSSAPVTITNVEVRVEERRPPMSGTLLDVPCGDPGEFRGLEADLDVRPPRVKPYFSPEAIDPELNLPPHVVQPIKFPYQVSATEVENFRVVSETEECDCSWRVVVSWLSEGRSGQTSVTGPDGKLFRTTSVRGAAECGVGLDGLYPARENSCR